MVSGAGYLMRGWIAGVFIVLTVAGFDGRNDGVGYAEQHNDRNEKEPDHEKDQRKATIK